jgi:hypothetical protein
VTDYESRPMKSITDIDALYDSDTNVYLSVPYSHESDKIMDRRYKTVSKIAWRLMNAGFTVFSPISHSHPLESAVGERRGHDFWMNQDLPYLTQKWAGLVILVKAEGWRESEGVTRELEVAEWTGIPVEAVDPLDVMTVVGISGKKRSGKDTMADIFVEEGFERHAFAEPIKGAAKMIFNLTDEQVDGDRKEKTDPYWKRTPREIMQHFGTDAFRETYGEKVWVDSLIQRLRLRLPSAAVVKDVRFPNEVTGLQERAGADVIRIDASERLDHDDSHASETALDGYDGFDRTVANNGSLADFKQRSRDIAQNYL